MVLVCHLMNKLFKLWCILSTRKPEMSEKVTRYEMGEMEAPITLSYLFFSKPLKTSKKKKNNQKFQP